MTMQMLVWLVAGLLPTAQTEKSAGQSDKSNRPELLKQLIARRHAIQTGFVQFTYENLTAHAGEYIHYTGQLSPSEAVMVNWGNQDGVVLHNPDRDGRPHRTLITHDYTWASDDDAVIVARSGRGLDAREGVFALRALGAGFRCPYSADDQFRLDDELLRGHVQYEQRIEGGMTVVTARSDADPDEVSWWFSPECDWNPVRITHVRDGVVREEARIQMKKFEGVWFPEAVSYFNGGRLEESFHISGAEFNGMQDKRSLGPEDIGVEPGFIIQDLNAKRGDRMLMWDGSEAIPTDEFARRLRSGELARGPGNQAAIDALPDATGPGEGHAHRDSADVKDRLDGATLPPMAASLLTEWQKYTTDFIKRFELDARQTERAETVLEVCERQARKYVAARRAYFEMLAKEQRTLDEKADPARKNDLERRLADLLHPMKLIFERQLKPGLEKLPTEEQRKKARPAQSSLEPGPSEKGEHKP